MPRIRNPRELITALEALIEANPECVDYKVAQQDCFSEPRAFADCMNVYIGTYYETESGGYLDKDDVEDDEEIEEEFPVVVVESF